MRHRNAHAARGSRHRIQWCPDEGHAQLASSPQRFLEANLIERVRRGPIQWEMIVTIGEAGDPESDPTKLWPKDRREIGAGTLTIDSAQPQKGAACEKVNFDPLSRCCFARPPMPYHSANDCRGNKGRGDCIASLYVTHIVQ
jgi:hypothetical protein